jgi:hypothetical protein
VTESGKTIARTESNAERMAAALEPRHGKPVRVGRGRARADQRSVGAASVPVKTLAAEVESGVDLHLSLLGVATNGRE